MNDLVLLPYEGTGTDDWDGKPKNPFRPKGAWEHSDWCSLDARPNCNSVNGLAFFLAEDDIPTKNALVTLGIDPSEKISFITRNLISNLFSKNLEAITVGEVLKELILPRLQPTGKRNQVWCGKLWVDIPIRTPNYASEKARKLWFRHGWHEKYPRFDPDEILDWFAYVGEGKFIPLIRGASVLASDTFNRANETPLASPWVDDGDTNQFNLTSNHAVSNSGFDCAAFYADTTTPAPQNQFSECLALDINDAGGSGRGYGCGLRMLPGKHFYRAVIDLHATNNVELGYKDTAFTQLWLRTATFSTGQGLYAEIQGSTIVVKANGVAVGASQSDGTLKTGQFGIVFSSSATGDVDSWQAGSIDGIPSASPVIIPVGFGAQQANNSSPLSPAIPSGVVNGDLLLLSCAQSSAAGVTFTPPAGWLSIARNSNATRGMTIEIFAKFAATGESAPSVACGSAIGGWCCQIAAYRNVSSVIEDAADVSSDSAAAATFVPTTITTVTPNARVISYVCSRDDNALNITVTNGFFIRMSGAAYDNTLGNGQDYSIGWADIEKAVPGAPTSPTWNQTTNGTDAWVGLTIALQPKGIYDGPGGTPYGEIGSKLMQQLLAT